MLVKNKLCEMKLFTTHLHCLLLLPVATAYCYCPHCLVPLSCLLLLTHCYCPQTLIFLSHATPPWSCCCCLASSHEQESLYLKKSVCRRQSLGMSSMALSKSFCSRLFVHHQSPSGSPDSSGFHLVHIHALSSKQKPPELSVSP